MNWPDKNVTVDQVLLPVVANVSNNLELCKDIQQKYQKLPECVEKKSISFNFFILFKIVSLHQFRDFSIHVISKSDPSTNIKGQKIAYKLPFVNRLNFPTHF